MMKYRIIHLGILMMALLTASCTTYGAVSLVKNGISNYKIVIASDHNPTIAHAAEVLNKYVKMISGADIPIAKDGGKLSGYEILIGNSEHLKQLGINVDDSRLGDDGFVIQTNKNYLIITGGKGKGALYGVYSFLETYLGCRMYSADVKKIPTSRTITLGDIRDTQIPKITYRDLYYQDAYDPLYTEWHKLDHFNNTGKLNDKKRLWGEIWSVSFKYLIPASGYFKTHPDFFALNNNKRIPDQLCLTNEAMFNEYMKNFTAAMKRFPDAKIWSVAPNDFLVANYCQCNVCAPVNRAADSPMGTLLNFVNKVAARFPDKIIATQAYLHYEEPPKGIKPASNVMIVECGSYFSNRSEAYTTQKGANTLFLDRLNRWLKLTSNVRVWDYVTNFPYLMCPFPNFHVLQPNIKLFVNKNITNVFEQGNIAKGGEFAELRAYILAKLLWNPDANIEDITNDFLSGYYGRAAPFIKNYIDLMTSSLIKSKIPLLSQDHPHKHFAGFLSPTLLTAYNAIFDKAESAVQSQPDVLERVKVARLPLTFAMLEASKMVRNKTPDSKMANKAIGYKADENILNLLDDFVGMCKKHGIEKLAEYPTTIDSYKRDYTKYANLKFKN